MPLLLVVVSPAPLLILLTAEEKPLGRAEDTIPLIGVILEVGY